MDDEIDCTKAMHALYEFLDGELTSERRHYIEYHLDGCPRCFSAFDFEAELRIVVRSRLRTEVPAALMARVALALEVEQGRAAGAASGPRVAPSSMSPGSPASELRGPSADGSAPRSPLGGGTAFGHDGGRGRSPGPLGPLT